MSKKLRVLLADDSRFFRAIESQFLKKTPVEIIEAEDSALALSMVRNEKPDMVYMAFSLPKEGAAACCKAIKSDPQLRSIPVVIICDQDLPGQPEIA
ncbi:MAG: response regulator, partial [Desulfuromonadales bacterium]|nr:response regulator [Desulfuromonadales bacterium]